MTNKKLLCLLGLALLVGFSACKDDDIVKGSPADEGDEVNFGAQLNDPKSRTYYGTEENGAFPIFWNTEAQGYDKIFIYAPNAMEGRNQAYYTVRPTSADQTEPAAVVKIGTTGIQWSNQPTNFYGFYPGNENFNLSASGNTVTATLPGDQTVTFVDEKLDNKPSETGYQFETKPDMSCVMMVAQTPNAINPTTDAVGLQFEPLSTVIDVTVCGPTVGNTTNPYRVTSVSLISDTEQLCGEFTYNFDTKQIETQTEVSEANKMITVRTMGLDSKGNYVGVPLYTGQTLNLKISMLPIAKNSNLKVQVTTADSRIWTKTLKTANLEAGQINPVTLPQLIASEAELDYSRWLSQLDPRIYISEISLPGSALSFNLPAYVKAGDQYITQKGTLDEQFNAGVRVFQGHIWLKRGTGADGGDSQFYMATSNGYPTELTLMYVVERLSQEMASAHSHGFCVLILSDNSANADTQTNGTFTLQDFYTRFKAVTDRMQDMLLLAPEITPTTTLADVRGKVIVKLQLNGKDDFNFSNALLVSGAQHASRTNSNLTTLQTCWQPLAISDNQQAQAFFNWWTPAAGSNVQYAPMTYGRIGSFTKTDASNPLFGDYTPATITQVTPGLSVEAARKIVSMASSSEVGNLDCNTPPTDMTKGFWFIYTDQSNVGDNYSQFGTNISNMVAAIPSCYTGEYFNKFFMTEVGGAGNATYTPVAIKNAFNKQWLDAVKEFGNYPLGWVLFNDVTDTDKTADEGYLSSDCITKVIEQNTKEGFLLKRDYSQPITPAAAPRGDVKGVSHGGSIF